MGSLFLDLLALAALSRESLGAARMGAVSQHGLVLAVVAMGFLLGVFAQRDDPRGFYERFPARSALRGIVSAAGLVLYFVILSQQGMLSRQLFQLLFGMTVVLYVVGRVAGRSRFWLWALAGILIAVFLGWF